MLPSRSGSWVVFTASVLVGASTYALLSLTHSYNVVAGPGALLRYRRDGALRGPLVRRLVLGTLPGVVLGAVIRVFALPGPNVFRLLVAALMLPLGTWLIIRTLRSEPPGPRRPEPVPRTVTVLALQLSVLAVPNPSVTPTNLLIPTARPAAPAPTPPDAPASHRPVPLTFPRQTRSRLYVEADAESVPHPCPTDLGLTGTTVVNRQRARRRPPTIFPGQGPFTCGGWRI